MNFKYNREDDILLVELNKKKVDYAEQNGDIIMHFSKNHEAVLMEILNAANFFRKATTKLPKSLVKSIISAPAMKTS